MSKVPTSPEKISEAFDLLETAAQEKKDNIKKMVGEGFNRLQSSVHSMDPKIHEFKTQTKELMEKAKKDLTKTAHKVDESVHQNPWYYLGGAVLAGLVAGLLVGRRSHS